MAARRVLGLILALALICGKGRTESAIPEDGQDQTPAASENSFSISIPLGGGNVIQSDTQVSPERRLSLEDFFLNNNNNQQQQSQPAVQEPVAQFQVQQPDPNSLFLVRDAQFPSSSGGILSRLLMARRMLRIRRIARRLTMIPRLFGLGLRQTLQRAGLVNRSPLSLFSNRVGEAYNPRDYVFGGKAFTYQNNTSDNQQRDSNIDQAQQQTRGFSVGEDPYYDGYNDANYDLLDNSNIRGIDSYENQDINHQQNVLNSLTNEQQQLLLQQLQNYQNQLNQVQEHLNQQPAHNTNPQNLQNQINDHQSQQYQLPQHDQSGGHHDPPRQNNEIQQNSPQQAHSFNEEQLEQIRELQLEILRDKQLQQQIQQQHLQQLQLQQQAQNLKQHQNLEHNYQNHQTSNNQQQLIQQQNPQHQEGNIVGDRTEGSSYTPQLNIGNSAGGGYGPGGQAIGVGVNVGIKPPAVDIQVTKPVSPIINHFPSIVNPIGHKPIPVAHPAPVEPPLVPLGILPKPILNLKGRLFFGAEMGKGIGVKAGR